jgi:hypothetical protein
MTKDDRRDAVMTVGLLGGTVLLLWGASRLLGKPAPPQPPPAPPVR